MQENQPIVSQLSSKPISQEEPVKIQKSSNFLTILLSILLFISLTIAGYFAYQTQKLVKELQEFRNQELATPTLAPTFEPGTEPEQIPLEVLTKDWKTYINTKYGYSFKYPTDWLVEEIFIGSGNNKTANPTSVNLAISAMKTTSDTPLINFEIEDPKSNLSLPQTFDVWVKTLKENQYYTISKTSSQTLNNIQMTIFDGSGNNQDGSITYYKAYLFTSDNKYFYILTRDDKNKSNSALFAQILSTFKFIN